MHISYILEKLKNMFKVDVDIQEQKIVYRETIKKSVEAEGRHKKQSGGSGQFGVVKMLFEPINANTEDFQFEEQIHGGSVPRNYWPAVEKGLIELFQEGPLAGFPVIGVKATLLDGAYHAVDSNEISFKLAAGLAYKNAVEGAKPTLLEPIMKLEIIARDEYVGDVMGDINKRRGHVLGMEPLVNGKQKIIGDPLRNLSLLIPTLFSEIGTVNDKLKILALNRRLKKKSIQNIFAEKEQTTLAYLENIGFSETIITDFFIPFFSGIFLENKLEEYVVLT